MGDRHIRAIRRGVALGLALVGLWGLGLTTSAEELLERFVAWEEQSHLAVEVLAAQLGGPSPREQALSGWPRLLLWQSPLLAAGEEAVLDLRRQPPPAESPELQDGDDDEGEDPSLTPPDQGEDVLEMTGQGKEGGKYLCADGVYLYNRTEKELDAAILSAGRVDVTLGEGPQILIVHTHGSEAYSQSDGDRYEESDPYRTTDCTHNVVRVGEEMATVFRAHGFQVLHDTNLYDYPAYNGAYDRSKAAVEQWLAEYPSISVVLDVHRDALVDSEGRVCKLVTQEAGEKVAQVMLVLGSNDTGLDHPRWTDNLAFAVHLQRELVRGYESLARPIVLRSSRYNQQLSPGALLVEVGGHGNTLTEAIAGARLWADNVSRTLLKMKGE